VDVSQCILLLKSLKIIKFIGIVNRALVICVFYITDESDVRKKRVIREKVGLCNVIYVYWLVLLLMGNVLY